MMGERTKVKDGEKSQLALFCNAKEEILLTKKLRTLESLKRQAENALHLDQRILYKKFTIKLRRSELAHARLLGNKDLVKLLSRSAFPDLHSVVTDGSEKTLGVMLQKAETSRALSAPARIQGHLAAVSAAKKHICKDFQGKEAVTKEVQKYFGHTEKAYSQRGEQKRKFSGVKNASICENADFRKSVFFPEHRRPSRQTTVDDRYQEVFVKHPTEQQDQALDAVLPEKSFPPEGFVDRGLNVDSLEQKGLSGRSKKSHTPRPKSRNLFLGLNYMPLGRYPSTMNHTLLQNDGFVNHRVKLFLQKIAALQQEQSCPLQDYYSERLQETLGKKHQVNQDCLLDTEQEESKWNPVGPEANHRSITIKKLDRNFMGKDCPLEILTWDYNEILTKENLREKNLTKQ